MTNTKKDDISHPALDADPCEDNSTDQNRIDLNDPTLTAEEAVAKNLAVQDRG